MTMIIALVAALFVAGDEPGELTRADLEIRFWEKRLSRDPFDPIAPARLGSAYLQKARDCGRFSYYLKAEKVLEKSLELKSNQYEALVSLAFAYSAQHRFREALELARRAIPLGPSKGAAYGVLGDAALELGDVERAREAYKQLQERGSGLFTLGRIARLEHLEGDIDGAIETLRQAAEVGARRGAPKTEIAWCHVQMGEMNFSRGRWDRAERHYQKALEAARTHLPLEHLAELRAAQKRYAEALELYEEAIEKAPNPEFFEALGSVYSDLGKEAEARKWRSRALESYRKSVKEGNVIYFRHLADFHLADTPPNGAEALEWARRDMELRRDVHAYDTLAWALYHYGELKPAADAMEEALALGTQDAELFHHAGMIAQRRGNAGRAVVYLEKALAANPRYSRADAVRETLESLEGQSGK